MSQKREKTMTKKDAIEQEQLLTKKIPLNVEIGSNLIINIEGTDMQTNSSFIGMEKEEFLIISPPIPYSSVKNQLIENAMLVIKYFHFGAVYAFQTKIKSIIKKPVKLIVLEYPHLIQSFTIRKDNRIPCYIPIVTKIKDEDSVGILKDISSGGAFCIFKLTSGAGLRIADDFSMLCQFPGFSKRQAIKGIIKSLKRNDDNLHIGIEFTKEKMETDIKDTIKHYMSSVSGFHK